MEEVMIAYGKVILCGFIYSNATYLNREIMLLDLITIKGD